MTLSKVAILNNAFLSHLSEGLYQDNVGCPELNCTEIKPQINCQGMPCELNPEPLDTQMCLCSLEHDYLY